MKRYNNETFINKCKELHGEKYSYEFTEYTSMKNNIKIFCNSCNIFFEQNAYIHSNGAGCKLCSNKRVSNLYLLSTDDFIKKSKKIHGNKYDYSKTNYVNNRTKIKVICCSCRSEIEILPISHYKSKFCKKCKSTEDFLKKANKKYGNQYSFEYVDYENNLKKIKIFCNKCRKFFLQSPNAFLSGHGCQVCSKKSVKKKLRKKYNKQLFIKKAKHVHGNKYSYEKVRYKGSKNKVKIFCNNCKKYFMQTPVLHVHGCGCRCYQIGRESKKKPTTEQFIKRAKSIHGNNFSYEKSIYIDARTKITVFCKKCKEYVTVKPDNFLNKKTGCKLCSNKSTGDRCRMGIEDFIEKAKRVHGEKYDYSLVNYENSNKKIKIICKNCNLTFDQSPSNHVSKHNTNGCPNCKSSSKERLILEWLTKNNINTQKEKTFNTCINPNTGYKLRFDFFIEPDILLEYNGAQHYKKVGLFDDNDESLEKRRSRDKIKINWAKNNNYKLYIIKYNENAIERLEEIFKKI